MLKITLLIFVFAVKLSLIYNLFQKIGGIMVIDHLIMQMIMEK